MGSLYAVLAIASGLAASVTAYTLGRRTAIQRAQPSRNPCLEAASMGHELRNRLTAITGYVTLLTEHTPAASRSARTALDAEIVDLTRLARSLEYVDSLQQPCALSSCLDVAAFLSKVVADRQTRAEASGVKLVLETQPGAVSRARVMLSAEELETLVGNVVDHAIAVSAERKVTVVLAATEANKESASHLEIALTHDSPTYSAREARHLFDPDAGLSTVNRHFPISERIHLNAAGVLARRGGGAVRYIPNVASGGRFSIRLKCLSASFDETAVAEAPASETQASNVSSLTTCYARHRVRMKGRSLSVLVVEDQISNQNVLKAYLTKAGHKVSVAGTVNEAIKLLSSNTFDLAIVDLRLPHASGVEFIQRARLEFSHNCRRFLVVTGEPGAATAKALRSTRVTRFLTKPVTASQLLDAVALATTDPLTNTRPTAHTEFEKTLRSALSRGDMAGPMADSLSYVRQLSLDAELGNWESFRRSARALRGAAHLLGASNLFSLCTIVIELPDPSLAKQGIDLAAELENELTDVQATLINFSEKQE